MSAEGRARIAAAQRKRWARAKGKWAKRYSHEVSLSLKSFPMAEPIQILTAELDGEDGLLVTFSDGTIAGYVTEELLELRPFREPDKLGWRSLQGNYADCGQFLQNISAQRVRLSNFAHGWRLATMGRDILLQR
jgi:hypothetical protein